VIVPQGASGASPNRVLLRLGPATDRGRHTGPSENETILEFEAVPCRCALSQGDRASRPECFERQDPKRRRERASMQARASVCRTMCGSRPPSAGCPAEPPDFDKGRRTFAARFGCAPSSRFSDRYPFRYKQSRFCSKFWHRKAVARPGRRSLHFFERWCTRAAASRPEGAAHTLQGRCRSRARRSMAEYCAQRASAGLIIAEATLAMQGNSAFRREPGEARRRGPHARR